METDAPSIRFTLTKGDLFWLQLRVVIRNRVVLGLYVFILFIGLNGLMSAPSVQERSIAYQIVFGGFVVVLISIPFWLLQLLVIANAVVWKKHQGVVCEHLIKLTPEGLEESTAFNSGLHKWAGIHRVESRGGYLAIYINETAAHWIPKRAFSCAAEVHRFEQHIRQAMAQSKVLPATQS